MSPRRALSFTLFVLALGASAFSQEFRASVTGRITDPAGTPVPNVKVTVQNAATNEQSTATTTSDGDYTVPFLIPGKYNLTVEAPGFKQETRNNIELRVNDKVTVNFAMQIGAVSESVEVIAAPPLLETASASRGGVIDNLRVTELPLNGRNPINLANLTPGVQFNGNPQFTRPFDNGDNVNFSINGGLRQTNEYLLDGVPDDAVTNSDAARTRSQQNIAYIPTVDATQEFKIVTNFYDAQYGRTGGGIVNITTKSGANAFHGTGYEFLRRYQLDANDIASNAAGRPRYSVDPVTRMNLGGHTLDQYGTEFSGPLRIPKVYNGKDKTFFAFGFENYVESTPSPIFTSVPTLAERMGDFSQTGLSIYDPLSTRDNPNFDPTKPDSTSNPRYIRTQFVNNIIPANRINSVGQAILKAYPVPNVGDPALQFNNYIASPNLSQDHFRNWIGRVDQNFGQRERMYFRYAHNRRNQFDNGANGFTGIGRDAQDPLLRVNDNAVVDSVTVLNPNLLLDLRAGFSRYAETALRSEVIGFDATSIGFPASFSNARPVAIPPRIQVNGYPDFGTRGPRQDLTNILSLQPSVSFIHGHHSIKVGSDLRDIRSNVFGGSFVYGGGQFGFSNTFTQQFPAFSGSNSGSGVASLLLGVPDNGIVQYTPALAYRWGYYAFYFQDDYKVTSRLTLNLGLRYDIEGSPTERYNRMNRGFAFGQASPLAAAASTANPADCPACANLSGGLQFTTSGNRSAFNTKYNDWQPRVGAAYQVASRTVVRGGYGIFFLPEAAYGGSQGFAVDTPFVSTSGGGVAGFTPANTLSNPFPSGILQPTGSSAGLSTFLGRSIIFQNPNRLIPYVHSFSFGFQHQLPWNLVLDAAYVGSRTFHVNTGDNNAGNARNLNVNTPAQLAIAQQNPNYFNQAVANPFAGLLPGTSFNGATIARRQLLLPFPQFGNVQEASESIGRIWYDSLQVNVEKRFSAGLVFVGAYTWSKNQEAVGFVNDQDLKPTKNLTQFDRTHRFVWSGVYQFPFGRGRHFGGSIPRALDLAIGGWEYNWIGTYESGTPLNFSGNADLIGDPQLSGQNFNQWFNGCVLQLNGTARQPNAAHTGFDACSNPLWAIRPNFVLRSIPFRSGQIRDPWRPQWDMSFAKKFNIVERVNAQFRLEAFNIFNTPIRREPNTDATSTQFGLVSVNQQNFPRQIQLGFKLNF